MNNSFDQNISTSEQARRYVIGAVLLGVLLANPTMPAWIALVACYPIFTAMIQWDPVNVLLQKVLEKARKEKHSPALNKANLV